MTDLQRIDLEFGKRELPHGLTAVAVRNPGVETMAIGADLHVGQLDETSEQHGLAYLVGGCLEEGTERQSAIELAESIEGVGGALSGNESGARISCPARAADDAAALLREVVLTPGFRDDDVERVKREILTEIESDADEPSTVAAQRFRKEVYGAHPFARPSYGTRETVRGFTPDVARAFHAEWFRPSRGIVALSGPFELERSLDLLESTFAGFDGASPEAVGYARPELPVDPVSVHEAMDREQVHVFLGHIGVQRKNPDYFPLLVMDHVLGAGAGFTARIPRKLRDEMGLCYSVGASITSSAGEEPGTFRAYIGTSPEHRERAIAGFLDEIRAIRSAPPTAEELQIAQDYLCGSFLLGLERNSALWSFAVRLERFGLGFDYLQRFTGEIRGVTPADVQRVAAAHLHPDHVVIASAGAEAAEIS